MCGSRAVQPLCLLPQHRYLCGQKSNPDEFHHGTIGRGWHRRSVGHYIQEIGTGYASATVQQVLNMDVVNDYVDGLRRPSVHLLDLLIVLDRLCPCYSGVSPVRKIASGQADAQCFQ